MSQAQYSNESTQESAIKSSMPIITSKDVIVNGEPNLGTLKKFNIQTNPLMRMVSGRKPTDDIVKSAHKRENWITQQHNINTLSKLIANGETWRPGINETTNKEDGVTGFYCTALDFDEIAPDRTSPIFNLASIAYRSPSWTEEQSHKERLVFVFSRVVGKDDYARIYDILLYLFAASKPDTSCGNASRFFYGSNYEVTYKMDAILDVDRFMADHVNVPSKSEQKKKAGRPRIENTLELSEKAAKANKGKKRKANAWLSPADVIYDHIYENVLECDPLKLYCLYPHNFKERAVDFEDGEMKFDGANPFSPTDASGTSFALGVKEGELPIFYDRSGHFKNKINGRVGGTFLQYWFAMHDDFKSMQDVEHFPVAQVVLSIFRHFNCNVPIQYRMEFYKDTLRRLPYKLKMNRLGDIVEYNGKPISSELISWFSAVTLIPETKLSVLRDIVTSVARENTYHPFEDKIESIDPNLADMSLWHNLATELTHISKDDEQFYLANKYLQKTLLAAIARVKYPGCKFDTVTVIHGTQGIGKSNLLKKLFYNEYFGESATLSGDRDNMMVINRSVCHELAEIDAAINTQKEIGQVRHFLTQAEWIGRLPYAVSEVKIKRQSIFVGTVNRNDFLNDPEGNRRYWVIRAKSIRWIGGTDEDAKFIDKVWATALKVYNSIQPATQYAVESELVLSKDDFILNNINNAQHERYDSMTESVLLMISKFFSPENENYQDGLTLSELGVVLYGDIAKFNASEQRRIGTILRKIGYTPKQVRIGGVRIQKWFPPIHPPTEVVLDSSNHLPVTEPVVTEPVVTEPVVTEPVVTEPVVTEPVVTEPVVTEPVVTEPVVTEPVVTEPVVTEPVQESEETETEETEAIAQSSAPIEFGTVYEDEIILAVIEARPSKAERMARKLARQNKS